MSARVEINEIANENDALKMEVAKARYSKPTSALMTTPEEEEESLSDAEKARIINIIYNN